MKQPPIARYGGRAGGSAAPLVQANTEGQSVAIKPWHWQCPTFDYLVSVSRQNDCWKKTNPLNVKFVLFYGFNVLTLFRGSYPSHNMHCKWTSVMDQSLWTKRLYAIWFIHLRKGWIKERLTSHKEWYIRHTGSFSHFSMNEPNNCV